MLTGMVSDRAVGMRKRRKALAEENGMPLDINSKIFIRLTPMSPKVSTTMATSPVERKFFVT